MNFAFIPGQTVEVPEISYTDSVVLPSRDAALTEFDQAMALRQVTTLYAGTVVRGVENIRFG